MIHIFNKRPVQEKENRAQFRTKSIKPLVLVITVSLSNNITTLTDTLYTLYILNLFSYMYCMPTIKSCVWQQVYCESDNFFKNTIEKTFPLPLLITIVMSYYGGIYVKLQFAFIHSNTFNWRSRQDREHNNSNHHVMKANSFSSRFFFSNPFSVFIFTQVLTGQQVLYTCITKSTYSVFLLYFRFNFYCNPFYNLL